MSGASHGFSVLLLLLLMPFGACAVSESNSFDKRFITFHCCSSCAENKRLFAVHCCRYTVDRCSIHLNTKIVNEPGLPKCDQFAVRNPMAIISYVRTRHPLYLRAIQSYSKLQLVIWKMIRIVWWTVTTDDK